METTTEILKVKKYITKYISKIPDFIDTKSLISHRIWMLISDSNYLIVKLVSDKVFTKKSITNVVISVNNKIEQIGSLNIKNDIQLEIAEYYVKLFDYIIDLLLEYECFEALENIKRFNEVYYKKQETNNE